MKIGCPCGAVISDTADYLPNKAYLVADEDVSASWDEHVDEDAARAALWALNRTLYICGNCGRLCIEGQGGELRWFHPEGEVPTAFLGSKLGSAFKVHVRAHWRGDAQPPGEVWWGGSGDRPGGYERFRDIGALRARYVAVCDMLRRERRLRDAFLSIDGEIVDRAE